MGCPDNDTLGALVAGELSESDREAIAIHAASCELCHAMLGHLSPDAVTPDERDGVEELALAPGTEVGRYTIESRIGAGGMGVVYAATDRELERRVALKLLRPDHGDRHARARLVREAKTLAQLSHPNIVTVFDAGEHRGHVFVVMELVDGGNVLAWCARKTRSRDAILDCMIDAARGLAAAHAAGVVHRDVKPDNILVGNDDRARVTDFGLARFEADPPLPEPDADARTDAPPTLTRTGTLLGTPLYMAPEVLRGVTSTRADQWAYCAALYEVVAGVRPFPVEPAARARAIAAGQLAPPAAGRRVPVGIRTAIARGLREEPHARWDSMKDLVAALVRARRRPRAIALAAAVLVVGGGATAMALREPEKASANEKFGLKKLNQRDFRKDCGCAYSACDGTTCFSECKVPAYKIGNALPGISVVGRQEVIQGASASGDDVLFLAGQSCASDHLHIAHRRGDTYVPVDLNDQLDPSQVNPHEGCCTLSSDSTTIVMTSTDGKRFLTLALAGDDRVSAPSLLLDPQLPEEAYLRNPVLSFDGRTLYFNIEHHGQPGVPGPLDGIWEADREDTKAPFTSWRLLPYGGRNFDYVTGVSTDGLSLFMADEYFTRVMTRATTAEPFADPRETLVPPVLNGWRAIPVDKCRRLMTTITPGGCEQEDITEMVPE